MFGFGALFFKLSPSKITPKTSPVKLENGSGNVQELSLYSGYSDISGEHLCPGKFIHEVRPVNNKENLLRTFDDVETNDLECSPRRDSGYVSVLVNDSLNQDEEDFSTSITSAPLIETPKQEASQEEIESDFSCAIRLPMLHFEQAFCSTLKRNFRSRPMVDWDIVEEEVSREDFGLHRLIGKKMGLEKMDIVNELFQKDFKHVLCEIFRYLSETDLINVVAVSKTWKEVLENNKSAYSRYKQGLREIHHSAVRETEHTAARDDSFCRIPLTSVQKIADAACCVSKRKRNSKKKKSSSYSRHSEFTEVAKALTNGQCLKVCRDCGSPAKYDSYQKRAICTRESCQLDFCTLCNCQYHFSNACATSKAQNHQYSSEPLPGSKKSKQNLRRI